MPLQSQTDSTTTLITFASRGRIGLINPDGTDERYLQIDVPNQARWQAGPRFADGRRMIVHSFEDEKTWLGTVQTHIFIYDWISSALSEIATEDRLAPFVICAALLPGEQRMVANPIIDGEQRVFTMNLDGTEPQAVTQRGDGFAYGVTLSPDAKQLAFHITPYQIWTVDLATHKRVTVAAKKDHLYFGPVWSPNGGWLAYLECHLPTDPGHDWANLCIGRPDGSQHRVVTEGRRHWFGTSYGSPKTRGGGSNMVLWSNDGAALVYTRALPGSRPAWQYQPQCPDTDHFNRDYLPHQARGGTELCLLNPFTGEIQRLTQNHPPLWDFRPQWSPDGRQMVFSRVGIGSPCELWVMDADGSHQRFLTRGNNDLGADFGSWLVLKGEDAQTTVGQATPRNGR